MTRCLLIKGIQHWVPWQIAQLYFLLFVKVHSSPIEYLTCRTCEIIDGKDVTLRSSMPLEMEHLSPLFWLQVRVKLSQRRFPSDLPECPGQGNGLEGMWRSVDHPVMTIAQNCEPVDSALMAGCDS